MFDHNKNILSQDITNKPHVSRDTRLRAVRSVLKGMSRKEVAKAYGIDRATLCRWLTRFYADGEKGLARKAGSGRPRRE